MKREWCDFCQRACNGIFVDFGLGEDEAWGSKIKHSDIRYVSDCCHVDLNDVEYEDHFDEPLEDYPWEE